MALTYEMLRTIASNGSNLIMEAPVTYEMLRELVSIAKSTGAQITLPSGLTYDIVRELTALGGRSVTVVNK
jgi:hypothetical protein